jgi:hypothetical protein
MASARASWNVDVKNVAKIHGSSVRPISELAAQTKGERAENFKFTDRDQELLERVLADDDGQDAEQPA